MAEFAPQTPTTSELHEKIPQTPAQRAEVAEARRRTAMALGEGTLALIGPCAMTLDELVLNLQGQQLAEMSEQTPGLTALQRAPMWKPRTRKEDWHGLETSHPEDAYRIAAELSGNHANLAAEIGHIPHLERYGHLLTLGWKGGRNMNNPELTKALALHDPTLPILVKNGLDGEIDDALEDVRTIENLRGGEGAPAMLLYRGGQNAKTPEAWEEQYLRAYDITEGRLVVDWAHGGEQAHDPEHKFGKSVMGQIACMDHMLSIAEETGKVPAGIIAEASDTVSPTDPVMPFTKATESAQRLANIKQSLPV